jgi:electron transport complex protein RnfC
MGLLTFKGGIHPDDGKRFSKDQPIRPVVPQGELVYPLSQHIGAPAKPVVKKGDCVLKGQLIAEAGGFVSSPIYSSVSGKVKGLEQRFNPTGSQVECIVVENDGEYKEVEYEPVKPLEEMTREEIINKIGDAGIVGMGGAGFPTKVKLSPKEPDKIEYIIANCAECEPYITADYRRMLEYTEDLVSGMKVILSLFPNARGVFAVEDNKKDCIEKLQKAVAGEPRIDVKALMTKYPQGAERQLIYAVTKRAINSTMLPADAGCIVDNVETLIGIHNAVIKGKPLMERVVTVDAPVTKTSSSILLFKEDVVAKSLETACINCGRCVEICPSRIIPSRLADFSKRKDEASFVAWNGLECVECGSCSYVCPAKRQLKQAIGSMRKTALANRKKK